MRAKPQVRCHSILEALVSSDGSSLSGSTFSAILQRPSQLDRITKLFWKLSFDDAPNSTSCFAEV